MGMHDDKAKEIIDLINEKADVFDKLCIKRHEAGAQEYGHITFLGNDVVRMMIEELADTTNYCRMQAIKLLMLQEQLEAELMNQNIKPDEKGDLGIGFESFKGTGKVGW